MEVDEHTLSEEAKEMLEELYKKITLSALTADEIELVVVMLAYRLSILPEKKAYPEVEG